MLLGLKSLSLGRTGHHCTAEVTEHVFLWEELKPGILTQLQVGSYKVGTLMGAPEEMLRVKRRLLLLPGRLPLGRCLSEGARVPISQAASCRQRDIGCALPTYTSHPLLVFLGLIRIP